MYCILKLKFHKNCPSGLDVKKNRKKIKCVTFPQSTTEVLRIFFVTQSNNLVP